MSIPIKTTLEYVGVLKDQDQSRRSLTWLWQALKGKKVNFRTENEKVKEKESEKSNIPQFCVFYKSQNEAGQVSDGMVNLHGLGIQNWEDVKRCCEIIKNMDSKLKHVILTGWQQYTQSEICDKEMKERCSNHEKLCSCCNRNMDNYRVDAFKEKEEGCTKSQEEPKARDGSEETSGE